MSDYFLSIEFIMMKYDFPYFWHHLQDMDDLSNEENQ